MTALPELLIAPDVLPGLDPVGLRVWNDRDELEGHVVPGVYQHLVYAPTEGDGDLHPLANDPWKLDLANAATRDRVARWVAVKVGLTLSSTAPRWDADLEGCGWWMDTRARGREGMASFASKEAALYNLHIVPGLADIENHPDMTLADGSLLVDALALRVVAQHLGGVR